MKKVVKMWDAKYANNIKNAENLKMPTELGKKGKYKNQKIKSGSFYGRLGEEAVIKLSDKLDKCYCEPWHERTCYVFSCNYDETKKPIRIEISFQRRIEEHPNTQAFYEFLNEKFGKKFILSKGRINPNHLVLKKVFAPNSLAEDICKGMKELIELTQKSICEFLANKKNDKLLMENEEKIFSEIMEEYGIEKYENDKLYDKCKDIYSQTIKILRCLHIGSDRVDEFLKVSYYTKKSIARSLLLASKDENKCGEFRLYYTNGMNDPHEGKTLLSFLGIESEDSKLPETLPFIACFSLEINSLNQFRLYGNEYNKEANGVSIVFKSVFFSDDTNKENGKYSLYRCVYIDPYNEKIKSISFSKKEEEENQKQVENKQQEDENLFIPIESRQQKLKELFEYLKDEIEKLLKINNIDIDKHELAKDLLINIRYLVKDYAFMEERECRIIDIRGKRNKKDESIKIDGERLYIEIGEVKDYISEIYFAPCAEGMEVFKIETNKKCIRSRHPYKPTR